MNRLYLNCHIDEQLFRQVKILATELNLTIREVVTLALTEWLDKQNSNNER